MAVVVAVVVAVATASAVNKTWIFKCLKFLRIIIITYYFHILLIIQKVVVVLRSHIAMATRNQFHFKIGIRLVAVPLATATHLKIQLRLFNVSLNI